MKKVLAVFDFDGTLTTKDTFLEFIKFYKGNLSFWLGFIKLSPHILLYLIQIIPNWRAKEYVLAHFFKGEHLESFQHKCDEFSKSYIPKLVRKEALQKLEMHQRCGHEVVVISASAENWLAGWCKEKKIKLIGTKLEANTNCLTGKLIGNNCYGPEKLVRLKTAFVLNDYDEIHVYGDSKGDKEILEIASHPFYRRF